MHTRRVLGLTAAAATVIGLLLPMDAAVAATTCVFSDNTTTKTHGLTGDCELTTTGLSVEDGWTIDGNSHTITVAGSGFAGPIIASAPGSAGLAPTSMHVMHLTIQASGFSAATGRVDGILFDGAKGEVNDVRISGVSQGTTGDNGYGVEADNSVGAVFAATDQVKVDNSTTISGYQRAAIYAHGDLKLSVLRAVIGSPDAINGQAVAGVLATEGAHGSIKENHISLSDTEPASASAFGAGVQIVKDGSASPRRVEVKRNVFSGTNADFGISVSNPGQAAKMTAAIDCNLFRRSDSSATDTYGVGVGQWEDTSLTNVQVSDSSFEGNWKHLTGTVSGTTVTAGPANDLRSSASTCVPGAPGHVFAVGGDRRSKVTWAAPTPLDYAPLTGYLVTAEATGHPAVSTTVGANATSATLTGLNNKLTYVVTVTAQSNGGTAAATDRLYPTKISLTAHPGRIHRGDRSILRGVLSSRDPNAHLSKRTVHLWAKPRGGKWSKIGKVRTKSGGHFSLTVKPRKKTVYRAVYSGHPDLASQGRVTVVVKR
jgi:Fibronectin type III domain